MADIAVTFPSSNNLFAFNRYTVRVENMSEGEECTLTVAGNGKSYSDLRVAGSGDSLDIVFNHYLQLLFDRQSIIDGNVTVDNVEVSVTVERTIHSDRNLTVYWGCIGAGERLGDRTLRYYPALNNPVPIWVFEGATMLHAFDSGEQQSDGTVEATQILDWSSILWGYFGVGNTCEVFHISQIIEGAVNQSTFDETFDYTFWAFGEGDVLRNDVIIDCATTGVYLKWIDPQGIWYYYVFEPYTQTAKTKEIGDDYEIFAEGENVGYYGALRPMGITRTDTQVIVAPLVKTEERRVLDTILTSPLVYWCPDIKKIAAGTLTNETAEWIPVRIVAGSTKDDLSNYADFEITVQYPDRYVQTL